MERLTYWNCKEKGSALPVSINEDGDTVDLETLCARLAAYEDTGLEPEEIDQICRAAKTMMFETVADFVRYSIANFEALQAYRALGTVEELAALVKARDEGPCGLCRFNPPSSCDGKPCTMCPAQAAQEGGPHEANAV